MSEGKGRGGARPGAGRPPGSGNKDVLKAEAQEQVQRRRADHAPGQPATVPVGRPSKKERETTVEEIVAAVVEEELAQIAGVGITEALLTQMCLESLACLRAYTRRGNLRAAMFLTNLTLGKVEPSFGKRARRLGPEETEAEIRGVLERRGVPEPVIELTLARLRDPDPETQDNPDEQSLAPVLTAISDGPAPWEVVHGDGGPASEPGDWPTADPGGPGGPGGGSLAPPGLPDPADVAQPDPFPPGEWPDEFDEDAD